MGALPAPASRPLHTCMDTGMSTGTGRQLESFCGLRRRGLGAARNTAMPLEENKLLSVKNICGALESARSLNRMSPTVKTARQQSTNFWGGHREAGSRVHGRCRNSEVVPKTK
jgi:hypothetical protein